MFFGMETDNIQKMYVKGSLINREEGFVFQIKNLIEAAEVSGIAKLLVDNDERSLEGVTVELDGKARPVSEVSWAKPLYVRYGDVMTIYAPGPLEEGQHTITITVNNPEIGSLSLPFTDKVDA